MVVESGLSRDSKNVWKSHFGKQHLDIELWSRPRDWLLTFAAFGKANNIRKAEG